MYDGFSTTNINLDLGGYTVPKTTFDFKASSGLNFAKSFETQDLEFTKKYNFNADFSGVFSGSETQSSTPATSVPSTKPYIWKYQ